MDLSTLAALQLADFDLHHPGMAFLDGQLSLSLDQAYELQFEVVRLRERRGERVVGYKIGCISRTMQSQLGLDRPVFGHVWETECHPSGCAIDVDGFEGLAIEGEFGVRLAADIPSGEWLRQNPEVLEAGFVVIELHNYVFRGPTVNRAAELVANNAIHAGVVLPAEETSLAGSDTLARARLKVLRNGDLLGQTIGGELEGGPIPGIIHLARHLGHYNRRLRRGQIILTGSPLPLWSVSIGDRIDVQSGDLGTVMMRVVGASRTTKSALEMVPSSQEKSLPSCQDPN